MTASAPSARSCSPIALFTFASALCGLSQSVLELVLFRILQGAGGGMLTPVGMAMLYRAYPPAERPRLARILVIPTVMAPALGPLIGGALVDSLSWRWVFFVNVPIGLAALIFSTLKLKEHRERAGERFDVPGFVLAASGFGLFLYALSEAATLGLDVTGHRRHCRCRSRADRRAGLGGAARRRSR